MEVRRSEYLPKGRIRNYVTCIKRKVAYRVWKRKLMHYGPFEELSDLKLIEVGCGPGYFLQCVENWFPNAEIYGLDIDDSLVRFAGTSLKRARLSIHDGQVIPFLDETFDAVCSLQVVEHLEKPERFFSEANRILKKNGLLIVSTPNLAGIPARVLGKKWQGYRHDHISLKTAQEWRDILRKTSFEVLDDGTTGLTGFKMLQILPFALINWIPLAIFGYFHWYYGESYMAVAKKK